VADYGRRVARDALYYGVASLVPKVGVLLLLPLYTWFMSTSEYGAVSISNTVVSLATAMMLLGMDGAITRYFRSSEACEEASLGSLVFTVAVAVAAFGLLFVGAAFLFGPALVARFIGQQGLTFYPYIAVPVLTAFASLPVLLAQALNRARGRALQYAGFQLGVFAVSTVTAVVLLVGLGMGPQAVLYGALAGQAALIVFALSDLKKLSTLRFSRQWLVRAGSFGLPLVPHYFAGWALSFADRYLLQAHTDLGSVGIYSVAYSLGMGMGIVAAALNQAWAPVYYDIASDEVDRHRLPRFTTAYAAVMTVIGVTAVLAIPDIVRVMSPDEYRAAIQLAPVIVIAYYMQALYFVLSTPIFQAKRTALVARVSAVAALLNIALNVALIPRFGVWAAAWTTVAAFLVMASGAAVIAVRLVPRSIELEKMGGLIAFFAAAAACGYLVTSQLGLGPISIGVRAVIGSALIGVIMHVYVGRGHGGVRTLLAQLLPVARRRAVVTRDAVAVAETEQGTGVTEELR